MKCYAAEHDRRVWLRFERYDADLVDELKRRLPLRRRGWDPDRKLWWVTADQVDGLAMLFVVSGVDLVHVSPSDLGLVDAPAGVNLVDAYRTLHLQPTAPAELVTAAYRILAKAHHPDRGGTTVDMQRINQAYEIAVNNRKIMGAKP